jgi:hypothetical protein
VPSGIRSAYDDLMQGATPHVTAASLSQKLVWPTALGSRRYNIAWPLDTRHRAICTSSAACAFLTFSERYKIKRVITIMTWCVEAQIEANSSG